MENWRESLILILKEWLILQSPSSTLEIYELYFISLHLIFILKILVFRISFTLHSSPAHVNFNIKLPITILHEIIVITSNLANCAFQPAISPSSSLGTNENNCSFLKDALKHCRKLRRHLWEVGKLLSHKSINLLSLF